MTGPAGEKPAVGTDPADGGAPGREPGPKGRLAHGSSDPEQPPPGTRRPWPQLRPDDWRNELVHLVDEAATRVQAATVARVIRRDKPEPRWPVTLSVLVAVALQVLLPHELTLLPGYVLPALEFALVVGLVIANPVRIERFSRPVRSASVALIVLITGANALSAGLLVHDLIKKHAGNLINDPQTLLASGAAIWATNVIAFALWYWEFDRGGPGRRALAMYRYPDLLFPQMSVPELTRPGWDAEFADYLYLSFTNATAFSPTDVMPLARWAKLTMLVQSAVSLAIGVLVIARAVNVLHG
jgi:uncharacterized membrane protein